MKRITSFLLLAIIAAAFCGVAINGQVYADASRDYNTCLSQSGHADVPSVQWACSGWAEEGVQHCNAWLGNGSGNLVINTSKLSGSVGAYYWGMCTSGTAWTSKLYVDYDNGAVGDGGALNRGTWGNPNSLYTTIDIGKFVQGVTPSVNGDYLSYYRSVYVWRCHGSNTSSCSGQWQDITVRIHAPSTTFQIDASLSGTPTGTTLKSDGKYYTDSATTTITFVDSMARNNDGKSGTVWNQWWLYEDNSSNAYENKGQNFSKNSGWVAVKTHTRTVNLSQGDNTFCETIGANRTVSYSGSGSNWGTDQACVTIHRYIWYSWDGQVVPSASGTSGSESGGILYVDANTANMSFSHQLKKSGGSVKTRYKTSRSNTPSSFPQQTNYTNIGLSSSGSFAEIYRSPASGTKSVDVAKDNGTQYCQTLYWYQYTREDRADSETGTDKIKTEKSANGCKTIRRYKTTFSGTIKVEYKKPGESTWTTIYNAGASEISPGSASFQSIPIASENIPTDVEVRFTHTITRSSNDEHGSPNTKTSYFTTDLGGTTGYRSGDPHGTATTNKATTALSAGGSDTHTDTFTVKIYPEQEITLCQKLTYRSEIQGAENTQNATTAGRRCFKLTKSQVSCQGVQYGIKNAKNYLTMQMYKNNVQDNTSNRLDTTKPGEMVTWVKPGDSVRFKYTMCAAGELASQFADKYITNYKIETNMTGYLFGKTVNDSPYKGTSKIIGTSNATPGIGPFPNGTASSHKYEYTTASPSDNADEMYSCAGGGLSDYYRIHDIHTNNLSDTTYLTARENCKADDYENITDVGHSFIQKATWSDIWYNNGTAVTGHTGGNATVVGRVNVPYNYSTEIKTTAAGGNVVLGQSVSAQVQLKIAKRTNTPVQAADYATYSKLTRYRLVQVVVSPTSSLTAATYNQSIKSQEYSITDNRGDANLATRISHCRDYGVSCDVVRSNDGLYYEGDNTFHTIAGSSVTVNIPDSNSGTYPVGTKICYIAAVWPSDSHGFANPSTAIDESNQGEALTETGSRWHLSSPSCFTVVKRPTLSSLGGDLYAPGGILGVTTKRGAASGSGSSLFGSWSEYGLVAGTSKNTTKGEIKGFASGASLWGGGTTSSTITRECYFSSMTFANSNCDAGTKELGKVPINVKAASYPERLAEQIRTRYTDSTNNAAKTDAFKINDAGGCVYDPNTNTYKESRTSSDSKFICLPGGAKYMHATANVAYIASDRNYCMIKGDTNNSRTAVIEADHTLVIGTNNVYGNNRDTGKGKIPGTGCYREYYSNISEIPQSIYIADTIILKDTVERMESWLIANNIYTCDPRSGYKTANDVNDPLNKNTINSSNCHQPLFINGPVIAKNLYLYRTGGGNGGSSNATPSEIFYLGPEAYLWSYNQAQRYSQATTTYQREIAPRY